MYPRQPMNKRDKIDLLAKSIHQDQIRLTIIQTLADGKWHSIHDLGRRLKSHRSSLGVVRIGIILSDLQAQVGQEFLEKNEAGEIAEWRLNPAFIEVVQSLLQRKI
ncbi:MAG: hypothetical protein ACTSW4_02870 [Candidatus Ranarchaeia archaeon]